MQLFRNWPSRSVIVASARHDALLLDAIALLVGASLAKGALSD